MRDIAVIGLGKFGLSVALNYSKRGGNVLAIDKDETRIQEVADVVTYAVKANVADSDVVKKLGIEKMDAVIVALTDNLEASVMATILSKEMGVPYVLVKAQNEMHAKVLEKVGADKVIFPEKEMGMRIARNMAANSMADIVELGNDYSIVEAKVPDKWVGRSLLELNTRKKFGFNVIAKKTENGCGSIEANIDPHAPFEADEHIIVIGRNEDLDNVF